MNDLLQHEFDRAVGRDPDALAVDAPDGRLSFAELDAWSDRLAAQLLGSTVPCAILLAPSTAYYASLAACMKAGCPAVPLEPTLPDHKLASIARDLGVRRCLTDATCAARAKDFAEVLDCGPAEGPEPDGTVLQAIATSAGGQAGPLHRILTSGSSGSQTAVTIGREAEVVHAREMGAAYGVRPGTVFANLSRHTSAAGVNAFWRGLLNSAGFMTFDLMQESLASVHGRLQSASPVGLQGQPTSMEALAAACEGRPPLGVERLVLGGESLTPKQLRRIGVLVHGECMVSVNYSSTETMHVACFSAPLAQMIAMPRIPVGRPLPSRRVVLQGDDGAAVAAGEVGEIVVMSRFLALAIEGPTATERFGLDPDDPSVRVYRTGDLGRINDAGLLEHLGRVDRQLKVNGVRVDPALVEAELERLPGVTRAVVIGVRDAYDRVRLVACVRRDPVQAPDGVLRQALAARLAAAFIPTRWVDVDAFPVGPTGKTDARALQIRCAMALHGESDAADDSPLMALLRDQWAKALRRPLGANPGSFYDEGGDSLAAAVLATSLVNLGATGIGPFWVAQHPTLAAQVQALQSAGTAPPAAAAAESAAATGAADPDEILRRIGWV